MHTKGISAIGGTCASAVGAGAAGAAGAAGGSVGSGDLGSDGDLAGEPLRGPSGLLGLDIAIELDDRIECDGQNP